MRASCQPRGARGRVGGVDGRAAWVLLHAIVPRRPIRQKYRCLAARPPNRGGRQPPRALAFESVGARTAPMRGSSESGESRPVSSPLPPALVGRRGSDPTRLGTLAGRRPPKSRPTLLPIVPNAVGPPAGHDHWQRSWLDELPGTLSREIGDGVPPDRLLATLCRLCELIGPEPNSWSAAEMADRCAAGQIPARGVTPRA